MMTLILTSRVLGLVRDRVIAHQFGQARLTDIYNAAFTIPDLLFFLIAGGALSSAFIPVFTEYVATGREKEAWRIFSVVASVMTLVVLGFILLGEIFTPTLVIWTNPGYAQAKVAATVPLTRILLPAQLCFFLGGLMMGTLNARHHFVAPGLGPVIYNACIILGGLFLTHRLGVAGLCWGALTGAILGNLVLQWIMVRRTGGYFLPSSLRAYWRHPGVLQVWRLMLPVILGLALPQVSTIVNKMFASALGDGPQSALMNANRLMQVPLGIFAQATAIAIFPTLAAQAARKEIGALRRTANFGIRSILFLTVPSSLLMVVLALPIVQLILHGGLFGPREAQMAASALIYYAIGIFAWSAHSIISRGFYALQDSRTPVIVGTGVTLIFIPLNWILMRWMSFQGLALATSIAATIHMLTMLALLRLRLHGIEGGRLLSSVGRIVAASVLTAFVCRLVRDGVQHQLAAHAGMSVTAQAFVTLTVCLSISVLVYGGLAVLMQMEEWRQLRRSLRRRGSLPDTGN
jgi:putative peptidoglycan lipid II flippase